MRRRPVTLADYMRRGLVRAVLRAVIVTLLVGAWLTGPGRTEPAAPAAVVSASAEVIHPHITHREHSAPRRLYVEVNDGSAHTLRPCREEDSRRCYWDSRTRGNGVGHSFAAVHVKHHGACVLYLARRYGRHHDYCAR